MPRASSPGKRPIAELSRRLVFSASHRLHARGLSATENRKLFGKCNHPNGHGHNYVLEVILRGEIDPVHGMVFNLSDLKEILERTIEKAMDHKNLNVDVPEFKRLNPTAENIARVCWERLQKELPKGLLYRVNLQETENNWVSYQG